MSNKFKKAGKGGVIGGGSGAVSGAAAGSLIKK